MSIHLYFSLIPEALIASMLPPEEFGQYYVTGHKFKSKVRRSSSSLIRRDRAPVLRHRRRRALRDQAGRQAERSPATSRCTG